MGLSPRDFDKLPSLCLSFLIWPKWSQVSMGNFHTWTNSSHAGGLGTDQLFSRWLI